MPSLGFSVFIDKVEAGEKTCTIRAHRKVPIKVEDALYFYTGMRTKKCRSIKPWIKTCREAWNITITRKRGKTLVALKVDDLECTFDDQVTLERLARFDGFACAADFVAYFLPGRRRKFKGQLIRWQFPKRRFIPTLTALRA